MKEAIDNHKENPRETLIKTLGVFPSLDVTKFINEEKIPESQTNLEESVSETETEENLTSQIEKSNEKSDEKESFFLN